MKMPACKVLRRWQVIVALLVITGVGLPHALAGDAGPARNDMPPDSNVVIPPLAIGTGDRFDSVRQFIRDALSEQAIPSISVAVAREGEILWEEGFGWADRERGIPATAHTAYSIASISKPLTATALMTLVEQGKIGLDRPINDYLGASRLLSRVDPARDATVRQVLNHTSGLPKHFQFFFPDEPYPIPSKEETIARYGNLTTLPGEAGNYSNLGYGILDHVIERVSGMAFADYLRTRVFLPLGMHRSSVGPMPGLSDATAVRYDTEANLPLPVYTSSHEGGGGVYASAHDLLRFAMFHMGESSIGGGSVLSAASLEQMHRSYQGYGGDNAHAYGLGWLTTQRPGGRRVIHHNGGMMGVTSHMLLIPEERIAVVVLANRQPLQIEALEEEILKLLLPDWQPGYFRRVGSASETRIAPALQGSWDGRIETYEGGIPVRMEVLDSGEIHVRLEGQLKTRLDEVSFDQEGALFGETYGDLRTRDVNRGGNRYTLVFALKRRGDRITGSVTAAPALAEKDSRRRMLGHWVELHRVPAGESTAAAGGGP